MAHKTITKYLNFSFFYKIYTLHSQHLDCQVRSFNFYVHGKYTDSCDLYDRIFHYRQLPGLTVSLCNSGINLSWKNKPILIVCNWFFSTLHLYIGKFRRLMNIITIILWLAEVQEIFHGFRQVIATVSIFSFYVSDMIYSLLYLCLKL